MSVEISNQQVFPKFDGEAVISIKYVDGTPQLEFNGSRMMVVHLLQVNPYSLPAIQSLTTE